VKKDKRFPSGLEVEFDGGLREEVTAHAGVALLVETGRRSGVIATADRVMPAKKNPKGLSQSQMVESFVVLSALAGECIDDFDKLREDRGLEALLGYRLPAASTARAWLDRYHDEDAVAQRPAQGSFIPQESAGLVGLSEVVAQTARAYVSAVRPDSAVTPDVDAHLVESSKRDALMTYEGFRGYQPMVVTWAETELILADQFRDGNVPAGKGIAEVVDDAYAVLPDRVEGWTVRVRSDSAAYDQAILAHWDERGWKFAVTADMTLQFREEISRVPCDAWHLWEVEKQGHVREWAEVPFVPGKVAEKRNTMPYRYLAIRIRSPQGVLFADGTQVKVFGVVTNDWDTDGLALLEWHRGKAGTVEHAHRILKDELGAGVYPSGKFGANAAWLRLQVLTHNELVLMKAVALDKQYRNARPKRLRFAIFNHVGRIVHHARHLLVRLMQRVFYRVIQPGLRRLRVANWAVT
jgi:hypothetical protein